MQKRSSCYIVKVITGPRAAARCQFVLALPSFLMLALPTQSDPRLPLMLCWQLWRINEEESITVHRLIPASAAGCAGFQSSLQVLTCLWLFSFLQLHFLDLYLPSSSHHCVSTNSFHKPLLPYHSQWFCFPDWIFLKLQPKCIFKRYSLKTLHFILKIIAWSCFDFESLVFSWLLHTDH